MLDNFAASGFDLFVGSETFLHANITHGCVDCISVTVNVNPAATNDLFQRWQSAEAQTYQQELNIVRGIFGKELIITAFKTTLAHFRNDRKWKTAQPPPTAAGNFTGRAIERTTGEGQTQNTKSSRVYKMVRSVILPDKSHKKRPVR